MKTVSNLIAWTVVSLIIVFAAVQPDHGVVYQSPFAALGVGLIGLGLCKEGLNRRPRRPA